MEQERFPLQYARQLGEEDVRGPLRNRWRIVHLLGNPRVLNTLIRLGRSGMSFSELRHFLCTTPPKRAKIPGEMLQLKEQLSDEPALQFHLPEYSSTSQMARDLRELKHEGILEKRGDEWCLNMQRYENIVCDWEQHQDLQAIGGYNGNELIRFGRYVRIYSIPRALISNEDYQELESIAGHVLDLIRRAYDVEHQSKVRAWNLVRGRLISGDVPESIANRLMNLFMWYVISPVMSHRIHYDGTPELILSQMLNAKEAELMSKRIDGRISRKASFESQRMLMDKYVRPPNLAKNRNPDQSGFELPDYLEEPDFRSENDKEVFKTLLTYIGEDESKSDMMLQKLLKYEDLGIDEKTLRLIRDLWVSMLHGATFVVSTPRVPFVENPWFFITEKEFVHR